MLPFQGVIVSQMCEDCLHSAWCVREFAVYERIPFFACITP